MNQANQEHEMMVYEALVNLLMIIPKSAEDDWKTVVSFCGMSSHFKSIFNQKEVA